jgi:acetyltransferase-like isoleucine patch superfamily enzyme
LIPALRFGFGFDYAQHEMSRSRTPEEAMRGATRDMIQRAIKLAAKKKRTVYISKSAKGAGVDIRTLDPRNPDGKRNLEAFLTPVLRHYTFSGLGAPEERNAINWRRINLPLVRRILLQLQTALSFLMKGTPLKIKLYRWMGFHIGQNVEIMQMAWLDHFRPELIFIGDNTLIGAFSQITVHDYSGSGRFRYGLVEIGANCTIGAGTGIGPIRIEDNVRTLPGTIVSPYLARIRRGSVVGFSPPPVKGPNPASDAAADAEGD